MEAVRWLTWWFRRAHVPLRGGQEETEALLLTYLSTITQANDRLHEVREEPPALCSVCRGADVARHPVNAVAARAQLVDKFLSSQERHGRRGRAVF